MPTNNSTYSVSAILRKLSLVLNLKDRRDEEFVTLTYKHFKLYMMTFEDIAPVMTYERTVKEKYNLLKEFKFISESEMLNVCKVCDYLEALA